MGLARFLFVCLPLVSIPTCVDAHGFLIDPAQRSSLWRVNLSAFFNYDDNGLNCGGFSFQWNSVNNGKCGACGDPYGIYPYQNDDGGKYDNGVISKTYTQGAEITINVNLTAIHKGYFTFCLCPYGSLKTDDLQKCLDDHPLQLNDGTFRYSLEGKTTGMHAVTTTLPSDLTCDQCVLQWKYRTGNSWGSDEFGSGLGHGPQEHFINCADIAINPSGETTTSFSTTNSSKTTTTTTTTPTEPQGDTSKTTTATTSSTTSSEVVGGEGCVGAGAWVNAAGIDDWCDRNCNHNPAFCPPSHCSCP